MTLNLNHFWDSQIRSEVLYVSWELLDNPWDTVLDKPQSHYEGQPKYILYTVLTETIASDVTLFKYLGLDPSPPSPIPHITYWINHQPYSPHHIWRNGWVALSRTSVSLCTGANHAPYPSSAIRADAYHMQSGASFLFIKNEWTVGYMYFKVHTIAACTSTVNKSRTRSSFSARNFTGTRQNIKNRVVFQINISS